MNETMIIGNDPRNIISKRKVKEESNYPTAEEAIDIAKMLVDDFHKLGFSDILVVIPNDGKENSGHPSITVKGDITLPHTVSLIDTLVKAAAFTEGVTKLCEV